MKVFSLAGIITLVVLYVIADRAVNWQGKFPSSFDYSFDKGKKGVAFDFSGRSLIILAGATLVVMMLPKLF